MSEKRTEGQKQLTQHGVLTVTSGKVFLKRLYIFLWDCKSPWVRSSLAPSFVLPFDLSFRLFSSCTFFTWEEKNTTYVRFKIPRCTQMYSRDFFRDCSCTKLAFASYTTGKHKSAKNVVRIQKLTSHLKKYYRFKLRKTLWLWKYFHGQLFFFYKETSREPLPNCSHPLRMLVCMGKIICSERCYLLYILNKQWFFYWLRQISNATTIMVILRRTFDHWAVKDKRCLYLFAT